MSDVAFGESLTVGLGVLWGLVWYRRTGWSCGGLVTPGLLALHAATPMRGALCLLIGLGLSPILTFTSDALGLYGRERVGAAVLLALALRLGLLSFPSFPLFHVLLPLASAPFWVGWVIPGLIAADAGRQGALMTLCGAVSCAVATAFSVGLMRGLG